MLRVPDFVSADALCIDRNEHSAKRALVEFEQRNPYMIQKRSEVPVEIIKWARLSGLFLEQHIVDYFEARWNTVFRHADNSGQWDVWSDHDFQLVLPLPYGRILVDVSGPRRDGSFGLPKGGGKHRAFIHLLVYGEPLSPPDPFGYERIIWFGVIRGEFFTDDLVANTITSPQKMITYLDRCNQCASGEKS